MDGRDCPASVARVLRFVPRDCDFASAGFKRGWRNPLRVAEWDRHRNYHAHGFLYWKPMGYDRNRRGLDHYLPGGGHTLVLADPLEDWPGCSRVYARHCPASEWVDCDGGCG